jgi:hypothetical protein
VKPADVYTCDDTGEVHICTVELCDSRECSRDGMYVCTKTNKRYGHVMVANWMSKNKATKYVDACTIPMDKTSSTQLRTATQVAKTAAAKARYSAANGHRKRDDSYKRKMTWAHARSVLDKMTTTDRAKGLSRGLLTQTGLTSGLVHRTLQLRAEKILGNERLLKSCSKTEGEGGTSYEAMLAMKEARSRLVDLRLIFSGTIHEDEVRDSGPSSPSTSSSSAGALIPREKMEIATTTTIGGMLQVMAEEVNAAVTPPLEASLSFCYGRAMEMAAVAVVLLPTVLRSSPSLSPDRQVLLTETYGNLIWHAWTLVTMVRPAIEGNDGESKFRNFSLGVLYQSKFGFDVKFDVESVEQKQQRRQDDDDNGSAARSVTETMKAILAPTADDGELLSDERIRRAFAEKYAIAFLASDPYLEERLVPENKIGTRNASIDHIQIDSVGLNAGISMVKEGLTAASDWAKRKFLKDVMDGILTPKEIERRMVDRSTALFVSHVTHPPL